MSNGKRKRGKAPGPSDRLRDALVQESERGPIGIWDSVLALVLVAAGYMSGQSGIVAGVAALVSFGALVAILSKGATGRGVVRVFLVAYLIALTLAIPVAFELGSFRREANREARLQELSFRGDSLLVKYDADPDTVAGTRQEVMEYREQIRSALRKSGMRFLLEFDSSLPERRWKELDTKQQIRDAQYHLNFEAVIVKYREGGQSVGDPRQ